MSRTSASPLAARRMPAVATQRTSIGAELARARVLGHNRVHDLDQLFHRDRARLESIERPISVNARSCRHSTRPAPSQSATSRRVVLEPMSMQARRKVRRNATPAAPSRCQRAVRCACRDRAPHGSRNQERRQGLRPPGTRRPSNTDSVKPVTVGSPCSMWPAMSVAAILSAERTAQRPHDRVHAAGDPRLVRRHRTDDQVAERRERKANADAEQRAADQMSYGWAC